MCVEAKHKESSPDAGIKETKHKTLQKLTFLEVSLSLTWKHKSFKFTKLVLIFLGLFLSSSVNSTEPSVQQWQSEEPVTLNHFLKTTHTHRLYPNGPTHGEQRQLWSWNDNTRTNRRQTDEGWGRNSWQDKLILIVFYGRTHREWEHTQSRSEQTFLTQRFYWKWFCNHVLVCGAMFSDEFCLRHFSRQLQSFETHGYQENIIT